MQYPAERWAFSANRIGAEAEEELVEKTETRLSGATKIDLEQSEVKIKEPAPSALEEDIYILFSIDVRVNRDTRFSPDGASKRIAFESFCSLQYASSSLFL